VRVLGALLVGLLALLLLVEGGLRLAGLGPQLRINRFHPRLGWEKTPGRVSKKRTSEFDVTFAINARGLRGPEVPDAKGPGEVRIVFAGDSFCLGYTVEEKDLFLEILGERLRGEGRTIAVVNGGTEGYSTDQEALWFREEGVKYGPDLAVLCFYPNDVFWCGEGSYLRYPKPLLGEGGEPENLPLRDPGKDPWIAAHTALGRLVGLLRTPTPVFTPEGASRPIPKEEAVFLRSEPDFLAAAWRRVDASVRIFAEAAKAAQARAIAVAIPHKMAVHDDARVAFERAYRLPSDACDPNRPTRRFLESCAGAGIFGINPVNELAARARSGERLYYEKDWHLTPEGNRALASVLYDRLGEMGILARLPIAREPAAPAPASPPVARSGRAGLAAFLAAAWILLAAAYAASYRDEPLWAGPVKAALFLALLLGVFKGVGWIAGAVPWLPAVLLAALLGFVVWKSAGRLGTTVELVGSFGRRGHWYMLPLLVVMVSIGTLLVVAASSPFVAPFIYTLF
jgi:hypothetical protein